MKKMTVKIENRWPRHAIGKTADGEVVFVKNGDLTSSKEVEVVVLERNEKWITAEIPETYQNEILLNKKMDKDQLIHTKDIKEVITPSLFKIENKLVFPDHRIQKIITHILNNDHLWSNSRLALGTDRPIVSAAFMFGISYKMAIEKLIETGYAKARLYCPQQQDFTKMGAVADMLANTYVEKNGSITMEIWQGVENTNSVHYCHGEIDEKGKIFTHFDCAIIDFDITQRDLLFNNNMKIKGGHYQTKNCSK